MSPAVKSNPRAPRVVDGRRPGRVARVAREIEAWRTGVYRLSEEERAAIDASRCDTLASDEEVDAFWKRRGLS
jgi:hypothetical protein